MCLCSLYIDCAFGFSIRVIVRVKMWACALVRVCPSVSESVRVCPGVSECARVCPSVSECARVCQSVSEFPRISLRMCGCADMHDNACMRNYTEILA